MEIGTAIVPVYSRTPAVLAMTAATLSRLGGGRPMHLGIGAGGQVTVERWHGVPFEHSVTTVAETIAILRQALAGQKTDVSGRTRESHGFSLADGPDYAARIHVGGMGPKMLELAANAADGLIVTWLSARILTDFQKRFAEFVVAGGRRPEEVELIARAYVGVCDDPDAAQEGVRRELVEYLISPPYGKYFASVGFAEEVAAARAGFEARDREKAVAAVSDALLDEVLICGRRPEDVAVRLREYFAAGADHVMVQPVPFERGGDPERTIQAVAAALG
jgi:probable F420-dependent oxidoreductase